MLHTVKAILDLKPTQSHARRAVKYITALLSGKWQDDSDIPGINLALTALGKDVDGTVNVLDNGEGQVAVRLDSKMDGPSMKGFKADLAAFLTSDEFQALPTKATKMAPVKVDVGAVTASILDMTVREYHAYCELHGVKSTVDRGVWSAKLPGVGGTVYMDSVTAERLGEGEKGDDLKLTLTIRKTEGKLTMLAHLVSMKRAKLTNSQKEFVADCAVSGFTIPAPLLKFVPISE